MPTIREIKVKVDLARNGIEQETARIILQFEQQILDLVREKQLYERGIGGLGKSLKPYKDVTVWLKQNNKYGGDKRTDNTTLKDRGNFYRSFKTDYGSFELEIFATDPKTDGLVKKYGKDIFMMTPDSEGKLSTEIIRPNLIKYFNTFFK